MKLIKKQHYYLYEGFIVISFEELAKLNSFSCFLTNYLPCLIWNIFSQKNNFKKVSLCDFYVLIYFVLFLKAVKSYYHFSSINKSKCFD